MKRKEQIVALELAVKQLKGDLRKARRAQTRNANIGADLMIERDRLSDALKQALEATKENGGWARIAERQRIYIKSLEERLSGTWDPAATHQKEYDLYYSTRKARY